MEVIAFVQAIGGIVLLLLWAMLITLGGAAFFWASAAVLTVAWAYLVYKERIE